MKWLRLVCVTYDVRVRRYRRGIPTPFHDREVSPVREEQVRTRPGAGTFPEEPVPEVYRRISKVSIFRVSRAVHVASLEPKKRAWYYTQGWVLNHAKQCPCKDFL